MELKGKITIDGRESEFMLLDDGGWTQWGVDQPTAGERVDLLDKIAAAYQEWQDENLCSECKDHLLDDGEGYDGKCGNCADKAESADEDPPMCPKCDEELVGDDPKYCPICDEEES